MGGDSDLTAEHLKVSSSSIRDRVANDIQFFYDKFRKAGHNALVVHRDNDEYSFCGYTGSAEAIANNLTSPPFKIIDLNQSTPPASGPIEKSATYTTNYTPPDPALVKAVQQWLDERAKAEANGLCGCNP